MVTIDKFAKLLIGSGIVTLLLLMAVFVTKGIAQTVTTGSLIQEMRNLRHLAEYPDPAYQTFQYSSYDRRSKLPDGKGWYANSDGFGREPIPNFEAVIKKPNANGIGTYLICDVDGPGAIVRGWTASINGTIKAYLDGSKKPFYAGPANPFFKDLYTPFVKQANLFPSTFKGTFKQRDAGYFPIPFAKHLRVEWIGNINKLHFYQLEVRKYEKGTRVETFKPADLDTYRKQILNTTEILRNPDQLRSNPAGQTIKNISALIPQGAKQEVLEINKEGAVDRLALKLEADNVEKALRQTVLSITFDGEPIGSVQSPVGDFFGAAPGVNPFVSLPFTVKPNGTMICRFVMPFEKSIKITLENRGNQVIKVTGSANVVDYDWNPLRSMHLQAHWRIDNNINPNYPYDLPFVSANGQGVYVGTSSLLFNPLEFPTPGGNWWGEGDEKVFVDEHPFPTIFGTGSEDYYNYSWSSPDIFEYPYVGQPRNDGPGTRGFVTNHRWHILDSIPFEDQLQFFMGFHPHASKRGFSYARLSYLYARPGLKDNFIPISDKNLKIVKRKYWSPKKRGSVFYQTEDLVSINKDTGFIKGNLWADGGLFVWYPQKKGDELTVPFSIPDSGNYKIWITAAKMAHTGKISVQLDHHEAGFGNDDQQINLASPYRKLLRNYSSEKMTLRKGGHTLDIKFEEPESKIGKDMVGIDFIWIQHR